MTESHCASYQLDNVSPVATFPVAEGRAVSGQESALSFLFKSLSRLGCTRLGSPGIFG